MHLEFLTALWISGVVLCTQGALAAEVLGSQPSTLGPTPSTQPITKFLPAQAPPGEAQGLLQSSDQASGVEPRYTLVEEFTAATLPRFSFKIGTDLDSGITDQFTLGTDMVALAVGIATVQTKYRFFQSPRHTLALGFKFAALERSTLLWGNARDHFDHLSARTLRPSLAWTHQISPRLKLHTFWAKGLGRVRMELSEKGRRKLWETKHPGSNYVNRDARTQEPVKTPSSPQAEDQGSGPLASDENQEKAFSETSSLTAQSLQVQSVSGLAQERFQLTGELTRSGGNKILVSTRIERGDIEDLRSHFFRLTGAHQWIWPSFQIRLGAGLQYFILSGKDLDGELIDAAGV